MPAMKTNTLVHNLKTLRKENNLTQEAIATALGITRAAYAHYETGRRPIPHNIKSTLAEYYGITTEELSFIDYSSGSGIGHNTADVLITSRAALEAMSREELITHTLALTVSCHQQSATIKRLKSIIALVEKAMPSNLDEL